MLGSCRMSSGPDLFSASDLAWEAAGSWAYSGQGETGTHLTTTLIHDRQAERKKETQRCVAFKEYRRGSPAVYPAGEGRDYGGSNRGVIPVGRKSDLEFSRRRRMRTMEYAVETAWT